MRSTSLSRPRREVLSAESGFGRLSAGGSSGEAAGRFFLVGRGRRRRLRGGRSAVVARLLSRHAVRRLESGSWRLGITSYNAILRGWRIGRVRSFYRPILARWTNAE